MEVKSHPAAEKEISTTTFEGEPEECPLKQPSEMRASPAIKRVTPGKGDEPEPRPTRVVEVEVVISVRLQETRSEA